MARVRNCPKGDRKAKLDDIGSIGQLLTFFCKNSLFLVALNLDPKSALHLKIKKKMHQPNPFKGMYKLAF